MKVLVTGSSGLIGSEVVSHFDKQSEIIYGIDNNMRLDFFGPGGDTTWNLRRLEKTSVHFKHFGLDIRDREAVSKLFKETSPLDLIVHCAAQPSHDLAASRPFDDFDVNAVGTLNLLEATRQNSPEAVFVFLSTNKVYGDAPNEIPLVETESRWEYAKSEDWNGIRENMRIDQSKHSVFGASKTAADIMVQEYGKYFGMKTSCLRGGCLTGPKHSGVEAHGFLSYLVKTNMAGGKYFVYGYKGKQVRDNIHSSDVAKAIEQVYLHPRSGEVYNIGGERANSCSIIEAFDIVSSLSGKKMISEYVDKAREGDHICYITDMTKFRTHYPDWNPQKSLQTIIEEIVSSKADAGKK